MTLKTGVIIGIDMNISRVTSEIITENLNELFPGVQFAIVPHAQSVVFTFEEDEEEEEE